MQELAAVKALVVSQKKEWGEILSGFEARNRYVVLSDAGQEIYYAAEQGSLLARWLLKSLRPFTMVLALRSAVPLPENFRCR